MNDSRKARALRWVLTVLAGVGSVACSSSNTAADASVGDGAVGGPVQGAADMHCNLPDGGMMTQTVSAAVCNVVDGGLPPDQDAGPEYGATMYGTEGNDDDCKYHVVWTSTPIVENRNVTFTVTVTSLTLNGAKVTGAGLPTTSDPLPVVLAEVFLNDTHPAPNSGQMTTTSMPGVYNIGPILFDAPGQWTVRFHVDEECADVVPNSPHGHAAFYVNVP